MKIKRIIDRGKSTAWWKNFFTKTVTRQLFWGVALTHALLMTIFVIDLVSKQREFLYQQNKQQSIALVKTLAANGTSWILADDYIGMEEVINSQSLFPDLNFALFTDNDNKVLAHSHRQHVGLYLNDAISLDMLYGSDKTKVLFESHDQIDIATPVIANDKQIGWARVSLDRSHIVDNLQVINRNGYFYMLLAVLVGSVFAILLARSLTKAIHVMTNAANAVREGSRDVNFDVQRIDELGDLSCDFNDTVRALAENEAELKKYQQGLELIVEERTVELEASNSELLRANELILLHNEQIEGAYESLKKMQKQLVETEKMSALAYLVTGIAHELNTPLGIAYTANSCTENRLGDLKNYLSSEAISKKQILEYIQEALDATNLTTKNIQRSTLLVDRFKELDAQRHNYHIETINIKEHVNGVLLNRHIEDLRPAITVKVDIDDELNLLGNRKQFEQFLFHLFENSIVHAFENIEDRQISVSAFRDQDKIEFVYQDNGIGMAKEQVEKIFNPFYTSKLGSGSSGLGMNVVYNIIKHSFNGDISCHSELGKGTMLKVVFYTEIDYVDNL